MGLYVSVCQHSISRGFADYKEILLSMSLHSCE